MNWQIYSFCCLPVNLNIELYCIVLCRFCTVGNQTKKIKNDLFEKEKKETKYQNIYKSKIQPINMSMKLIFQQKVDDKQLEVLVLCDSNTCDDENNNNNRTQ